MRALTNKYKMENTALVDKVFKRHVEAGETSTSRSGGLNRSFGGNTSRSGILENDDSPQRTRRKRSVMNTSAVDIPTTDQEIVEAETTVAPRRHTTSGEPTYKQSNGKSSGRPTSSNKQRRSTSHLIDMIPDHKVAPQSNSTSDRTTIREAKDGRKISSAQKPQSLSPMMTNDTNSFRPMSLGIQDDLVNLSPATAYTTPPTTVPRLPSINGGKVKLPTLYVFGKLYPSTVIDAVFQALTFWIPQSGEHGKMQESIPLSKGAKAALRAPKDATYMTFISSEVPLYARNHANCHFALSHLVVPHHGFVFYNDNEQPVGLLALTCSTKISRPRAGEFRIPLQAMTPTTIPPNEILNYYLSYISDDILPSETSNSTSTTFLSSDLFHTQSMLGKGNSIASKRNSTTASDAFKLSNTGESNLCWLGFDIANCTLMFSNLFQEVWYPFAFN
ncbi:hypothetical protein AGDE_13161 [Angomonas deanei]|nr:hypothetical protein AGDE_13161 [Angomonas deanei]|eukprot:EPY22692.1 hypothetical protein AGDE_13161 [Angomonas deanei]